MHLYQNVQTYLRRENYARYEDFINIIISAFFNDTYNVFHKCIIVFHSLKDRLLQYGLQQYRFEFLPDECPCSVAAVLMMHQKNLAF